MIFCMLQVVGGHAKEIACHHRAIICYPLNTLASDEAQSSSNGGFSSNLANQHFPHSHQVYSGSLGATSATSGLSDGDFTSGPDMHCNLH